MNYKDIRDGKCVGLFALIEEILSRTVVEGFQGDEYFNALVDFRNVALGDKNIFEVADRDLFVVADAAVVLRASGVSGSAVSHRPPSPPPSRS